MVRKDLIEDWCKMEGIYLPKEAKARTRPISLLNVEGKNLWRYFPKVHWRAYKINKYVDETVQKGGNPRIPGCIEYCFFDLETHPGCLEEGNKSERGMA